MHFSLSHSGDRILVAVAPVPVGVDVETVPADGLVRDLVSALHPRERAELEALPDSGRPAAFARCWARKEAALKVSGVGLARGAVEPYVGAADRPAPVPGLRLADLPPLDGHAAALALALPTPDAPLSVPRAARSSPAWATGFRAPGEGVLWGITRRRGNQPWLLECHGRPHRARERRRRSPPPSPPASTACRGRSGTG